ncbi:hypothetical protein C8R47DRAFT_10643 [Mycena vitilis]|nr:hypothetical protein C8R47DRAFT_10643 [Mycena vitilis]
MVDPITLSLVKELRMLGLDKTSVDKAVAHVRCLAGLCSATRITDIASVQGTATRKLVPPYRRATPTRSTSFLVFLTPGQCSVDSAQKLESLIDMFTRQLRLGGESSAMATPHHTHTAESIERRLIETVVELGIVNVDIDEAAHQLLDLRDENWFPQIEEPLLEERLQTIKDMLGEGFGSARGPVCDRGRGRGLSRAR